jgi:DNA-binding MarR family transcriptional regulator
MEKLGIVSTVKSKRDARLAIAALTPAGREVLDNASGVVDDTMRAVLKRTPQVATHAGWRKSGVS